MTPPRGFGRWGAGWLLAGEYGLYLLVLMLVALPVGALFWELARNENPADLLPLATSSAIRAAFVDTLGASLAATLFGGIAGTCAALAIERLRPPGLVWLRLGLVLPLLIPPFVTALGWRQAYGAASLAQRLTGWQLPGLEGGFGVALLLGVQGMPLAFLTMTAALRANQADELARAARACGASPLQALWSVTLPLLRPAVAAAAGLVYVASASDFGIPAVLGIPGRFPTVTTQIYQSLSFSASAASFREALLLAALLAVLAVAALLLVGRWSRPTPVLRLDVAHERGAARAGAWAWLTSAALTAYVLLTAIGPLLALLLVALTRAYGQDPLPANWTLAHFAEVLGGRTGAAFGRSLGLAIATALILSLIGTSIAVVSQARTWGTMLDTLVALPFSVPGSTLAIGVILAFSRFWYGTLAIILVAYVARFWSLAERPALAAIAQVGPDAIRAARASGAGARQAWWTGVWPATRGAALVGAALVFLAALHELTVSSLLYAPGTETVAVVVLNTEVGGDVASTAAIGVLLTLVVLAVAAPVAATGRVTRTISSG